MRLMSFRLWTGQWKISLSFMYGKGVHDLRPNEQGFLLSPNFIKTGFYKRSVISMNF